jgi:hypothetical protein
MGQMDVDSFNYMAIVLANHYNNLEVPPRTLPHSSRPTNKANHSEGIKR